MRKTTMMMAAAGWIVLGSRVASAQETEGAFQLGIGTDIVTHSSATATVENIPVIGNQEVETTTTQWGFGSRKSVNLEAGYGITDSIVLGGLLVLGGTSQTVETPATVLTPPSRTEQTNFDLVLAPKFDFMFLPGGKVRPFLGAAIGLVIINQTIRNTDNVLAGGFTEQRTSGTGVGLLGRAGIRWFAAPGFSLDPAIVFGWQTASGNYETTNTSYDARASGWSIGLALGVSGWI